MAWSPDGEYIAFASSRMGFKDGVTYTDAPRRSANLPTSRLNLLRFREIWFCGNLI
jgi:Tol biopolymer transport system component